MNKNTIIGLLVLIVLVLGYFVISGNGVMQQAATIKSQNIDLSSVRGQVVQFAKNNGGTIGKFTESDLQVMAKTVESTATTSGTGGTNDRPYKCYVLMNDGGIYTYNYNSLYDQGSTWVISPGWMCKAMSAY